MDITSAAIATTISSSIATLVALRINKLNAQKNLKDQLDGIIKIAIQYPYLESTEFANTWKDNRNSQDDKYLRYDNYCTLLFNYLSRLCEHYNYNKKKIENDLNVKDWIKLHQQCWEYPSTPFENADGYSIKFKDFIESYLK